MTSKSRKSLFFLVVSCLLISVFGVVLVVIWVSKQNTITPRGIVIHHSAVPFEIKTPEDVRILIDLHKQRGFSIFFWGNTYYLGYHYVILPDGTVVKGRPETCRGAHAVGHNDFIGICLIGNFAEESLGNKAGLLHDGNPSKPTGAQLASLRSLVDDLTQRYGFAHGSIMGHNSIDPKTECPGANFPIESFYESQSPGSP